MPLFADSRIFTNFVAAEPDYFLSGMNLITKSKYLT